MQLFAGSLVEDPITRQILFLGLISYVGIISMCEITINLFFFVYIHICIYKPILYPKIMNLAYIDSSDVVLLKDKTLRI